MDVCRTPSGERACWLPRVQVSNPGLNPTGCPPCSLNLRVHASLDGGTSFTVMQELEAPGVRVWNGTHNNGTTAGYSSLVQTYLYISTYS